MIIDGNKFAVVIAPQEDSKGWTGDVDITIKYNENNTMSDSDKEAIINLMTLMTASVNLMEKDTNFLNKIYKQRDSLEVDDMLTAMDILENDVSSSPNIVSKEGNVIKINWTKQ